MIELTLLLQRKGKVTSGGTVGGGVYKGLQDKNHLIFMAVRKSDRS